MAIGSTWTYRVTDSTGARGTKIQTVLAIEDVGGSKAGTTAFRIESMKPSGKRTVSWQQDTGTSIVRHREQSFAANNSQETDEFYLPSKLRLDEADAHTVTAASWSDTYSEDVTNLLTGLNTNLAKTEQWTVEGVDVSMTVPAGTFSCLKLRRIGTTTASDKVYWFARGVGKVREEGSGQLEELSAYSL